MKYLSFILIILLVGCTSQKRCFKKFPPTEKIDTVYKQGLTEIRPVTVEVLIPGDTVYAESLGGMIVWDDQGEVYQPEMTVVHTISAIEARTDLAYSRAWVENNKLKMLLIQHDSIFQFKIDSAIRVSTDTIKISDVKIHEKEVTPKWATTYKSLFWFTVALLIIIILLGFIFIKMK